MGNKLRDDDLQLNIIVNGDKGQKELGELEKSTRELTNRNKELRMEKEKLIRAGKQETEHYKAIEKEMRENNKAIKTNEVRMTELRKQLGLTALTMRQLQSEQTRLKRLINSTTPNTEQWKIYKAELAKVEAQIAKVSASSRTMQLSMRQLADGVNRYYNTAVSAIAIATGVVFSIAQWTKGLIDLDDALADVMKTSGMARKEVRELYTDFRYMNTRTPRRELLLLAEEAGRLGKKSKKDVQDFVEIANQIKVALGDDLGGEAEVALREVGKLVEIYKVGEQYGTEFKESMSKVGSVINEVAANSNATAEYLIGYMKRLGGVSMQARISAADIAGYASTLDQLGQNQEMAATAQGKVIIDMFTDTAKYAQIARMEHSKFYELLQTDANEAFIAVLEGLNGNNEGLTVMAQKLDGLGIDGARAVQVLAALSSNTKMVRDQQEVANKAMQEGTSLINEYNIKNNNLAGSMAKIGQFIYSKFVNSGLIGFLENAIAKTAEWIRQPLAEMLQKEQLEVNMLVMQLTNLETAESDRFAILEKLREINPDIVEGINSEAINIEQLTDNLAAYNEEMAKRIVMANLQEDEQKNLNAQARSLEAKTRMEYELGQQILEINRDIAMSENTLVDKNKLTRQFLEEQMKALNGDERSNAYSKEATMLAGLNDLWINLGRETGNYNKSVNQAVDFSKRVEAMKQMLGISSKPGSTALPATVSPFSSPGGTATGTTAASPFSITPEPDSPISNFAIRQAQEEARILAEKKASEEEWNAFLKKMADERMDIAQEELLRDQENLEFEKELTEARKQLKSEYMNAIGQVAGALASMFKEGSAAQIAALAVEKGAAIAQIIFQTAVANAKAVAMSPLTAGQPWVSINTASAVASIATVVATTISQFKDKKNNDKPGYATGKYPGLHTGFYGDKPHYALFNEVPGEPEMVVDGKTTRRLQFNYPEIIKAIYAVRDGRQPGYAAGKYPSATGQISSPVTEGVPAGVGGNSGLTEKTIADLTTAINQFLKHRPPVYLEEFEKKWNAYNDVKTKRNLQ